MGSHGLSLPAAWPYDNMIWGLGPNRRDFYSQASNTFPTQKHMSDG
jgi:hypothetical protein